MTNLSWQETAIIVAIIAGITAVAIVWLQEGWRRR